MACVGVIDGDRVGWKYDVGSVGAVKDQGDEGERRRRLLGVKLRALVAEHLGTEVDVTPEPFGAGSAMIVDGAAWVLVDGPAERRLGASLAWAIRHDATSLDVIAEAGGATLARRATGFEFPIAVWFAEDRTLLPVVATAAPTPTPAPDDHLALIDMIRDAGATPHVEHGVVTGEVRGLEVCRVVDEPTTGNFAELSDVVPASGEVPDGDELAARIAQRSSDEVTLEVGVGANDREAFQLLHGHIPTVEALTGVVDAVSDHRNVDAVQHPLNRMAPERFLRWQVVEQPERLGLSSLEPVDAPVVRRSMKYSEPCVAQGVDSDGRGVVVVFSAGVDLDLIPFVADVLVAPDVVGADDRFLVAVPERDLVAITRDLAARLRTPVELVGLPPS